MADMARTVAEEEVVVPQVAKETDRTDPYAPEHAKCTASSW